MSPLAKSVVGRVILYFVALLIVMVLWALCGEARAQSRAQSHSADSAVVFFRCQPRKPPTKAQLDSLLDWAKSVYVEGGYFETRGFASIYDRDRRDETFARIRKEAGKRALTKYPVREKDENIYGGPGFYRGLLVRFVPPTVDMTARTSADIAVSQANEALAMVKSASGFILEPGLTFIGTSATDHLAFPSLGIYMQYKRFRVGGRGSVLPRIYRNTDQRFVYGEIMVGCNLSDLGLMAKLGGYAIMPHNWQGADRRCGFGGIEGSARVKGKFFIKPSLVLATDRFYRPEERKFRWDRKLRTVFTMTISAEL